MLKRAFRETEIPYELVYIDGGYDKQLDWLRKGTIIKMSDDPAREGQPEVMVFFERARPMGNDPKGEDWTYEEIWGRLTFAPTPGSGRRHLRNRRPLRHCNR